jgi:Domain of unknown function (DUF4123)
MTPARLSNIKKALWPPDAVRSINVYAVLDGARSSGVHDALARSYRAKSCLFAGTLDPQLERAAPQLLEICEKDSVTDFLLRAGWHDAWGILLTSQDPIERVRRHLRTLLRVRDETGRFLLFRFYDPRVLTVYLPTCTSVELQLFFGSVITSFFAPSTDPELCRIYTLCDDKLDTEHVH